MSQTAIPTIKLAAAGIRRNVIASLVGNSLEWYDFFLYATAASIVFGKLFFPAGTDPLVATLGAFAGFAVGFAARPLGGIIFGHVGDKYSRKTSLVLTLTIMAAATFLMGLLPTYAQVGIWAPALMILLRLLQGVAAGGEWGGGVLLISENSSEKRRGFLSAFGQSGVSLGFVLSAAVFYLVQLLPNEQFMSWGWRLPFLLSILIFGVGLFVRFRLPETKEFSELKKEGKDSRAPILKAIRTHPKEILVAMGLRVAENGGSYLILSFSLVYGVHVGVDRGVLLLGVMLSKVFEFCMTLLFGRLDSKMPVLVILAFFIGNGLCHAAMIGTQGAFFHELFSADARYSGMAIAHELAAVFAGGLAPLIATALLIEYNSSVPASLYAIALALITMVALAFSGKVGDRKTQPMVQASLNTHIADTHV